MVRDKITENINESISPEIGGNEQREFISNQVYLRSLVTPYEDGKFIGNLKKFYNEQIDFEKYKLNAEMNEREAELLKSLIGKDKKVLEMGCGTGRLLLEMKKAGYDITGLDFTPRHVEQIKAQDLEAKVIQGDWHQTGIKDESVDVVYFLGRNILHDYSFVDQVQTFREGNRVLKKGGRFILDIPNREKGGYKRMVDEYTSEMEKIGIKNFRFGSIYDSPDGEHFATRYAYSHGDIVELAELSGFKIVEVKKKELETGKGDENLYYVLQKI
jgi:ubiquinone/menaquinone biosynthesis C-methylase UbiE